MSRHNSIIDLRRKVAGWILLSVFAVLLAFTSLHRHTVVEVSTETCAMCLSHINHDGHFTNVTPHLGHCLLCHLSTLPYLLPTLCLLSVLSLFVFRIRLDKEYKYGANFFSSIPPRGPPYYY